jgi:hypothetical protein
MLTQLQRDELRRLAERLMGHRWLIGEAGLGLHQWSCHGCFNICREGGSDVTTPCAGLSRDEADYIVAAQPDVVLQLLDMLEGCEKQREAAHER